MVQRAFLGPEGACRRVVVSWMMAGGVVGGGILIGTLVLVGRGSPGLHLLLAPVLFLAGTIFGLLPSIALAIVGRPVDASRLVALKRGCVAALLALPLLAVSWMVSSAITVGTALRFDFRWGWLVLSVFGWIAGLALCAWALREGWGMIRQAHHRWTACSRDAHDATGVVS